MKMINDVNYKIWWNAFKAWIDEQCLYDNDTITYEELVNKMNELEETQNGQ